MELEQVIKARYSERDFKVKPVEHEVIMRVLASGSEAPNSCNMQTMQYIVVDEPNVRADMTRIATKKFEWAPVNIIVLNDTRITQKRHSGIMSIGMSVQNMILKATDLGLATCPMAGFSNDDSIREYFKIPDHLELVLVLAIGYSKDNDGPPSRERVPVDEITHWNEFADDTSLRNVSINVRDWSIKQLIDYRRRIAPVYRYSNHFRLSTYNPKVYEFLVKRIFEETCPNGFEGRWFDYDTYDGGFVKALLDMENQSLTVTISSHLPYVLSQASDFGQPVDSARIDLSGDVLDVEESFDFVSLVHKIQFLPNPYQVLEKCCELVSGNGHLVLAFDTQGLMKWGVRRLALRIKAFLKGESFNVYENNPYYKVGPYHPVSKKRCLAILKQHGFKVIETDIIKPQGGKKFSSNETFYGIFKREK